MLGATDAGRIARLLFIARFFVSSALMTLGVALLMTAFAQHRLLRLIDRLTAAG